MPSGRFFGFVIGGTHPAALAADWLVSAWDQNAGLRAAHPGRRRRRGGGRAPGCSTCSGCRPAAAVGFVTGGDDGELHLPGRRPRRGAAAGRAGTSRRAGWPGGPGVRVLVGAERHDTVDLALRYLGLGAPGAGAPSTTRAGSRPTRSRDALEPAPDGPTIVCLQAGNVHSGAFDPFAEAIEVAHEHGAWVHVDGAFGLWAAASPGVPAPDVAGVDGADSWATDAHKTLNVPYDCGLAIVRDPAALRAAMGDARRLPDPGRGRRPVRQGARAVPAGPGVPVWAALRALGRAGRRRPGRAAVPARAGLRRGASRRSPAPRCSTTWCSPRSASTFGDDDAHPRGGGRGCSRTARRG